MLTAGHKKSFYWWVQNPFGMTTNVAFMVLYTWLWGCLLKHSPLHRAAKEQVMRLGAWNRKMCFPLFKLTNDGNVVSRKPLLTRTLVASSGCGLVSNCDVVGTRGLSFCQLIIAIREPIHSYDLDINLSGSGTGLGRKQCLNRKVCSCKVLWRERNEQTWHENEQTWHGIFSSKLNSSASPLWKAGGTTWTETIVASPSSLIGHASSSSQ